MALSISQSKKRTKMAMEFLATIPLEKLGKQETAVGLADHLKDKGVEAMPKDLTNRIRKLVASGTAPVELSGNEVAKLASKLPTHLSVIIKSVKDGSYEKVGMSEPRKKHRHHVRRIFGNPRKGKLSKQTLVARDRVAKAGVYKRAKDRATEHPVRVTPPNITQDFVSDMKAVAKSAQKFSVTNVRIYPDEQGQWWRETQYLVTDTAPLGFFGKPTGRPMLPKDC